MNGRCDLARTERSMRQGDARRYKEIQGDTGRDREMAKKADLAGEAQPLDVGEEREQLDELLLLEDAGALGGVQHELAHLPRQEKA